MNILDSIVDGALALTNRRESDAFIGAAVRFMRTGEEPSLTGNAAAMWIAVSPVLGKSRSMSENGSKGGSKSSSKPSSKSEGKQPSKSSSKPSSRRATEQVSSLPIPDSHIQGEGCGEGEPPLAEEVRAYFGANCLRGDPAEFFDHFESQGWVRSNGQPIADWRAQARMWSRRQPEFDQSKPAEMRQPEKPLPKAQNAIDWEAELAKLEGGA